MCSEQPCIEPSQIIQPSEARAAPSWLGPPIRLLRSCPVFDALGVGRAALRLAENERKQAEKQAEPDMEETWDLSDPADPLNIGMGWGTGGHGLGL